MECSAKSLSKEAPEGVSDWSLETLGSACLCDAAPGRAAWGHGWETGCLAPAGSICAFSSFMSHAWHHPVEMVASHLSKDIHDDVKELVFHLSSCKATMTND